MRDPIYSMKRSPRKVYFSNYVYRTTDFLISILSKGIFRIHCFHEPELSTQFGLGMYFDSALVQYLPSCDNRDACRYPALSRRATTGSGRSFQTFVSKRCHFLHSGSGHQCVKFLGFRKNITLGLSGSLTFQIIGHLYIGLQCLPLPI
ncbi:hypothetical protein Naga_100014g73 [Nannochloropsis gaditana]|uniref:Uncharacterized protein n=1 Tax=Nannochloropsis gaditana TaxID=72520 RepID=W7TGJ6_9STRA|nr:hypothetical protein Naga_100014g73 [Nannochloropsis gaditana]